MAWLLGWKYRKKITIQDEFVDGDLTDFPAYVKIDADADFHEARADGYDIRFTLSDGKTLLKYDRDQWSGGNGSPATAHFWVKVPSILASGGAIIYVYYGKSDAPDGEDAPNVWDANFKGVWHLKEIGNGTDDEFKDSSGNANHGTGGGAEGSGDPDKTPDQVDGKVYKGQKFDGIGDLIDCGSDVSLKPTSIASMTFWANPSAYQTVYARPQIGFPFNTGYTFWQYARDGIPVVYVGDLSAVNSTRRYRDFSLSLLPLDTLTHVRIIFDGAGGKIKAYKNGVLFYSGNVLVGDLTYSGNVHIGNLFTGLIDEVRILDIDRGVDWHNFEHRNINEADNEVTWGIEEGILYSERLMDAYLEKKMGFSCSLEKKLNISAKKEEKINLSGFLEKQLDISAKTEPALAIKGILRKTVKGELT